MSNIIELIAHTQGILSDLRIKIKRNGNIRTEELIDTKIKINSKLDQMFKVNLDNTTTKFRNTMLNKSHEYPFTIFPLKDIKMENLQNISKKTGMDISEFFDILNNHEIDKKSNMMVYHYQGNSFIFNIELSSPGDSSEDIVPIVRIITKSIKKDIPEFKALCKHLGCDLYHLDLKLSK